MRAAIDLDHGVHLDVPDSVYHAPSLHIASKHTLDVVAVAPAKHKAAVTEPPEDEERAALYFGTAFHTCVFEPLRFDRTYVVSPKFDGRTKQGKADRAEWEAANDGKLSLEPDDYERVRRMTDAYRADPIARGMLESGLAEVTARWRDAETGLECKARADLWIEELAMLSDLKSCKDGSWHGFRLASERYGYAKQDAFYRWGWSCCGHTIGAFVFTCVEKAPPYLVSHFEHDPEDIEAAQALNRKALRRMAAAVKTGNWEGYPSRIQRVKLRKWAFE
jgi:exodeoxyribonuclease VIII